MVRILGRGWARDRRHSRRQLPDGCSQHGRDAGAWFDRRQSNIPAIRILTGPSKGRRPNGARTARPSGRPFAIGSERSGGTDWTRTAFLTVRCGYDRGVGSLRRDARLDRCVVTEHRWTHDPRDRAPSDHGSVPPPTYDTSGSREGRSLVLCPHGYVNQQGDLCPICDAEPTRSGVGNDLASGIDPSSRTGARIVLCACGPCTARKHRMT